MQNKPDVRPRQYARADHENEGRKCTFQTLFLNNSRKRGEEKGLSLWDAISVLWKLTEEQSTIPVENHHKIVIVRPTASFRSRIDLQIVKKYVFNISILKMPVALLFKFTLYNLS